MAGEIIELILGQAVKLARERSRRRGSYQAARLRAKMARAERQTEGGNISGSRQEETSKPAETACESERSHSLQSREGPGNSSQEEDSGTVSGTKGLADRDETVQGSARSPEAGGRTEGLRGARPGETARIETQRAEDCFQLVELACNRTLLCLLV